MGFAKVIGVILSCHCDALVAAWKMTRAQTIDDALERENTARCHVSTPAR